MHRIFSLLSFILILILPVSHLSSQDQNRYTPPDPYTLVNRDQHFSKYMIMNSGFLGPNGLPVPRLHKAVNPTKFEMEMKYEHYFQDRELTQDALINVKIPVAEGKVALEFRYVPFEFYEVEKSMSRYRRTESGEALSGHSFGDVYFGTAVQLVKDHTWLPDMVFGMSCKTASGTNLNDARHTDSPGYYFDLSMGETYKFGKDKKSLFRWYMLGGFYAWQTYIDEFPQNDAIFYGLGYDLDFRFAYLSSSLRGLSGWMFNGDQPVVLYNEIGIREGRVAFTAGYEWGIIDYPFRCVRVGFKLDGMVNE